uniref:Leucine-rich repeat domain-containing protein n=1 Tax=Rhodosorus marinus TaxID=101924 RepID=A0A7S3EKS0_9RHOD|mmetsp:Transcript_44084/g.172017  ORF Transcript_44084/g.172017 Transcript_44084/m.172017 type:complete len:354 (+) Transcript_44084:224-1285(+)
MSETFLEALKRREKEFGEFSDRSLDVSELDLGVRFSEFLREALGIPGREDVECILASSNGIREQHILESIFPESVSTLDLSDNRLYRLPRTVLGLHDLKELNLANNNREENLLIDTLCDSEFPKLVSLDISGNFIHALPENFPKAFPRLRSLTAARNKLTSLPATFGKIELEELFLSGNPLGPQLPTVIAELGSLKSLGLASCQIEQLDEELANLEQLKSLALMMNDFGDFPTIVIRLKSLRRLDLSRTGLKQIPEEISELTCLEEIYIAGNELKELPVTMGTMASLKKLDISNNGSVIAIPPGFAELRLEHLAYDSAIEASPASANEREAKMSVAQYYRNRRIMKPFSCSII